MKILPLFAALAVVAALAWVVYLLASEDGAAPDGTAPIDNVGVTTGGVDSRGRATRESLPIRTTEFSEHASGGGPDDVNSLRVTGRILDPYGEPLINALIGSVTSDRPATTAADGRFEVFVEKDGQSVTLLVLAPDNAPFLSQHEHESAARSYDAGDIQLVPAGGIRGRITDKAGNGLSGATTTLSPTSSKAWPPSLDLSELLEPVTTDADGAFTFANLAPGRYRITASAPGRQTGRSPAITVTEGVLVAVDPLVLEVGHELMGRVLDSDKTPVADAAVSARNGRNQPRYRGQVRTAADGRFQMTALPPGPLRVDVAKPGFLSNSRSDVDPTLGQELVVMLERGLSITGTVVDARTRRPVERFAASIRRIGEADPSSNGTMAQQLERQIDSLRASAADAGDPEIHKLKLRIVAEFEARLERVKRQGGSRPVAVPAETGPVSQRPGGRFSVDGLQEGLYSVGITSPDHQFAEVGPVALTRGREAPDLDVELVKGHAIAGVVVSRHDGKPIAGASVELMRVLEAPPDERTSTRSLYPWVFARSGPQGVTVSTTRTGEDGRFEIRNAATGGCLLSIRHPEIADHDTEAFDFAGDQEELRVAVGARATLTGQVENIPPGRTGSVKVVVLGGHGIMRTVVAQADGSYRIDGLQPGSYIVRAYPSDQGRYVSRLFGSIFPLHAGDVAKRKIPERDVTLAAGETRVFDLALDLPRTGVVQGTVSINGQPGKGGRAYLRPVPGEAPGSGGLSLRGNNDDLGRFTIRDVPAGKYTLVLYAGTRQELYREPITVTPGATTTVQVDLVAGGLRGRVTAPDTASVAELRGYVWVLPGATETPPDLYQYRRVKRTHRIRVRNGIFEDQFLTPGPAILVLDIRGRRRVATPALIPAGTSLVLDLTVAGR